MATRTIANGGGVWSSTGSWVEGAVPTASDDVVATATSGNLTNDVNNQAARSIDFTNYVGTWTINSSVNVNIGTTTAPGSNVALNLVPGMHVTIAATSSIITFVSSVAAQTITTAGFTLAPGQVVFNGTGGWVLQDGLTIGTGVALNITKGTFNSNGQSISAGRLTSTNANTRSVTLDNSAISLTTTSSAVNIVDLTTTTGLTWSAAGTSWSITQAGNITWVGNGQSFGALTFTAGTGSLIITGANTFSTLTVTLTGAGTARTLTLPASATTTVTTLVVGGASASRLLSVVSSSAGTAATISQASGSVISSFLSLKDSTATGGASFRAEQSTNVSGNTGWTFGPLLAATINGVSGASASALGGTIALAATINGVSSASGDINWAKPGKGGIGG